MSALATLLLGSLGKDNLAGGLTQGAKSLFGSGFAESGLAQGAIGALSTVALPAAAVKMGFDIAGDVMAGKNRERLQNYYQPQEGFRTNEFLTRSNAMARDTLSSAGVDDKMIDKAMSGSVIANTKLKRRLADASEQLSQTMPYLRAQESNNIGTNISNSIPVYQSPSYGAQGMKFSPQSKFSVQTKKI